MYVIHGTFAHTGHIIEASLYGTGDYTGQIHSFSEIGPGGLPGPRGVTPRPWVCDIDGDGSSAQWLTPDGNSIPIITSNPISSPLTGSELVATYEANPYLDRLRLFRGPLYNSPSGEYCCVLTVFPNPNSDQRRCVTLSEYGGVVAAGRRKGSLGNTVCMRKFSNLCKRIKFKN